jgi:hypothetical protein
MQKPSLFLIFLLLGSVSLFAQTEDKPVYKNFVGTSAWVVANLFPNPADFYELDYGRFLSEKDVLVFRAITWKYNHPLGIPLWSPSLDSDEEEYPGYARAFGIGVGYQRYLWKGLFAGAYMTPFFQNFNNKDKTKIASSFQLYLQLQAGYRISLFRNRFYIDPSVMFCYWPINTNMPESFKQVEKNWPNCIIEAHLNFGFSF